MTAVLVRKQDSKRYLLESSCAVAAADRRRRLDGWLRAFIDVEAPTDIAPQRPADGPLSGLPIAVKGSRGYTTVSARRLLAAGAVPIGATAVPASPIGYQTWGHTPNGPTRNPWRGDLSPGGSSAGAAAAVAGGIVPLANGADGAGSIRIPAAWCSVIGYKPTTTLAPVTDPSGLAVPGVLVRDPTLVRAWANVVLDTAPPPAPAPVSVGWSPDLGFADDQVDDEVVAIAEAAAAALAAHASLTFQPARLVLADPQQAWLDRRARRTTSTGSTATNATALRELFKRIDLLMTPTTPNRPHGHDGPGPRMSVALTWGFNLSGHPAVSVPAGFTDDGCPVGLQIVAPPGHDDQLLRLIETHVPVAPIAPVPA